VVARMTDSGQTKNQSNGHRARKKTDDSAARLNGLLGDLGTLHDYLRERGQHTYELAQRFMANSRRDASSRAYDERQATMLEYQQYIWHEIAGRVQQLLVAYSDEDVMKQQSTSAEDEHS
jgi:hypothetical protein